MAVYGSYLMQVRGLAAVSAKYHLSTAFQFIQHLDASDGLSRLAGLTPQNIEEFIRHTGRRVGRGSLQHTVAHVRSLLRFLASRGEVPVGLDAQIDTPRVYRGEQLPRALPWDTVCSLLQSIDRSTIIGRRDHAMLLLISTYGLRSSDVVGLRLEDIQWRLGQICVSQRKTAAELLLPLTDAVGDSLLAYLRNGRPVVPFREIFVRHRAPAGVLKPTAVTEAFQAQSRRSGLGIPFQGAHCLRHSFAVHLLRQGASLKVIGDVLGHRDAESTCVYLRLAVDDLRDVALGLPESFPSAVRP
jgi:site-specific recombinase XerD